jgi:hypothetical protein
MFAVALHPRFELAVSGEPGRRNVDDARQRPTVKCIGLVCRLTTAAQAARITLIMGGTPALPVLDSVTLAVCHHVADRLEAEAADLAETMTIAVINEIPEYATAAAPGQRQIVFEHSLDHVHAVVRAVRTWSLPSAHELAFVRERAALRATQRVPLSALLHSYRLGHRTVAGAAPGRAGQHP